MAFNFTDIIAAETKKQEEAAYNVEVSADNEMVSIKRRIEYDADGNPVHSLVCDSFDDALSKLKQFVSQNGHMPFSASGEYECSLRRWQHEIQHGIISLTPEQQQAYDEQMAGFADSPVHNILGSFQL